MEFLIIIGTEIRKTLMTENPKGVIIRECTMKNLKRGKELEGPSG